MIRLVLAAALALPGLASAEPSATVLGPPRPAAPDEAPAAAAPCDNTMRSDNCSRVLACVGEDGLWFDGRADGWNRGHRDRTAERRDRLRRHLALRRAGLGGLGAVRLRGRPERPGPLRRPGPPRPARGSAAAGWTTARPCTPGRAATCSTTSPPRASAARSCPARAARSPSAEGPAEPPGGAPAILPAGQRAAREVQRQPRGPSDDLARALARRAPRGRPDQARGRRDGPRLRPAEPDLPVRCPRRRGPRGRAPEPRGRTVRGRAGARRVGRRNPPRGRARRRAPEPGRPAPRPGSTASSGAPHQARPTGAAERPATGGTPVRRRHSVRGRSAPIHGRAPPAAGCRRGPRLRHGGQRPRRRRGPPGRAPPRAG